MNIKLPAGFKIHYDQLRFEKDGAMNIAISFWNKGEIVGTLDSVYFGLNDTVIISGIKGYYTVQFSDH